MAAMMDEQDEDVMLHSFAVLQNLDGLWKEKRYCDLVIRAEEQELRVHKNVVAAGSDYFNAMFKHDNVESCSGIVEMKDVTFASLEACIQYIYTGKISINEENVSDLLHVASILQLLMLRSKISHFLRNILAVETFFQVKEIVDRFDIAELASVINEFALFKLDLIVKETGFGKLDEQYVSFLISSKICSPEEEDFKFAIGLRWIKADACERSKYLPKLLQIIKVNNISWDYGHYLAENEPLCYQCNEVMRKLYLAILHGTPTKNKDLEAFSIKNTRPANAILLFDVTSGYLRNVSPELQTDNQMHSLHEDLCSENSNFVAVMIGHHLYVLNGNARIYILKLSDSKEIWIEGRKMIKNHGKYLRAVAHGDEIFVVGNDFMEKYNVWKDMWCLIDCEDIPRNECAVVMHKQVLHVLGGLASAVLKAMNMFNMTSSAWEAGTDMLIARRTPAALSFEDTIIVAGGFAGESSTSDVEQYCDTTRTWTRLTSMQAPRDEFSLCSVKGKIFALGSYNGPLDAECYDMETNSWTYVMEDTTLSIVGAACVSITI